MDKTEIIGNVITGITYIAPLAAIVWKLAKADSTIKENEKKIVEIESRCEKQELDDNKIIVLEQKMCSLENNLKNECQRADKMEHSLNEIKEDLRGVSTKLDMLLKYNIKGDK